ADRAGLRDLVARYIRNSAGGLGGSRRRVYAAARPGDADVVERLGSRPAAAAACVQSGHGRRGTPLCHRTAAGGTVGASGGALGMCLGAFGLLVIACADEQQGPEAVAWVLAALSGGSAIGGLVYGAVPWRASSRLRLAVVATALGLTLAATGLSPHPYVLIAW